MVVCGILCADTEPSGLLGGIDICAKKDKFPKSFNNRYKKTPLMRLTSDTRRPEGAAIKLPRKVVPSIIRNLAAHQCRCLDATAEPILQVLPIEIYIRGKGKSSN
jgi:hypothetical protein